MKHFWIILAVSLNLASCRNDGEVRLSLAEVESYINEKPDSALTVLRDMDRMPTKALEAKRALLHSMALDKCYIDLKTDSVIAPAMEYYRRKGSADDRLKAYYYRARIAENSGNPSETMDFATKGEQFAEEATDCSAVARLYSLKGKTYALQFDFKRALENDIKAKAFFEKAGSTRNVFFTGIGVVNDYNLLGDKRSAYDSLSVLAPMLPSVSDKYKSYYYDEMLNLSDDFTFLDSDEIISNYVSDVTARNVNWLRISNIYYAEGRYDEAESALHNFESNSPSSARTEKYYHHLADVCYGQKRYEEALDAYKTFLKLWGENTEKRINSDTRFVEERYEYETKVAEAEHRRTVSFLVMAMSLLLALCAVLTVVSRLRRVRLENAELQLEYEALTREREALSGILSNAGDEDLVKIVKSRLELIDNMLLSAASGDRKMMDAADRQFDEMLSDKKSFLSATRRIVGDRNPEFIKALQNKSLTDEEIDICCLYSLGLNGKSIKQYTGSGRHYQNVSVIRAKLGLGEHDRNIDRVLRNWAMGSFN